MKFVWMIALCLLPALAHADSTSTYVVDGQVNFGAGNPPSVFQIAVSTTFPKLLDGNTEWDGLLHSKASIADKVVELGKDKVSILDFKATHPGVATAAVNAKLAKIIGQINLLVAIFTSLP